MEFQTPSYICDFMTTLLPSDIRTVLEPTPGVGNLVVSLQKLDYEVTAAQEFWEINGSYDAVVMNPPFSPMKVGYEILYKCMGLAPIVIALMPWLTIINSHKRTSDIFNYGLKSVTHLKRSVFKGSRVQCCILLMIEGYDGDTFFNYYGHNA